MKDLDKEINDGAEYLLTLVKERASGEKYIELPGAILNPYTYKTHTSELASAAGITVDELSALVQGESALDTETGKILNVRAYDAKGEGVLVFSVAVEWLLKRNSPQTVKNYMMYEFDMRDDAGLHDHYLRILFRTSRYSRLRELNAPLMLIRNEWCMLEEAVFELYYGSSDQSEESDEQCLWNIAAKLLQLSEAKNNQ